MKELSPHSNSQLSNRFAANEDRKKFCNDETVTSIFDGPAVSKALSMRSSSNYPGSIIDQLRNSRIGKSFGTCEVIGSSGTGRCIVGTSSETAVPLADQSDSSSCSDTDDTNDYRLPAISLMSETQNTAGNGSKARDNCNPAVFDTQTDGPHVDRTVVRRREKQTDLFSSTDSESDTEVSTLGYVSKSKTSRSKSRKRRKRLTANLAGTRYEVGKN